MDVPACHRCVDKPRRWFVRVQGEDGLFRTVESHENLSTAYAQYASLDGVRQLLRGAHIVLRSDQPADKPADSLF